MKKRLVIKSKFRFFTFIFITLMVITCSFGLVNAKSVDIDNQTFKTVNIHSGDTLWNIAEEHATNGMDVRECIYDICELNDISPDQLYSGMSIKLPNYN